MLLLTFEKILDFKLPLKFNHFLFEVVPKESIILFLENRGIIYKETLELAQPDGTAVNTGWEKGVISLLEEHLERPLQWDVCFLHHLERPFLRFFCHVDGKTLGPEAFSGPKGKQIAGEVHLLPIVNYAAVPHPDFPIIDDLVRDKLSTDQKGLLLVCQAVLQG